MDTEALSGPSVKEVKHATYIEGYLLHGGELRIDAGSQCGFSGDARIGRNCED